MKRQPSHDYAGADVRGGQTVFECSCSWRSRPSWSRDIAAREFGRHQIAAQRAEARRRGGRR